MILINVHIVSWIILLILFYATYENYSNKQGPTQLFKSLHMATRLFMLLVLMTGFWLAIKAFSATGVSHMLMTLKMVAGIAVVGLIEVTLARKKKKASSRGVFIATFVVAIVTIIIGAILPWGPITGLFK
ncbi:TPA: YisL family protein [Staphylococcus delphini]|nr:YisL family protein [Staphylococcus delphini]HEC2170958.1 YisL family protein [Staphylococcus delphini]HEC2190761.1 YisL family protein [Staphylococcus delphini]HEC2201761.1 YisL family protein [Staphylococcus delphini]HEC2232033.1 YisL family protein [Staphylococcus delphini]